jgi:hypothetical protein
MITYVFAYCGLPCLCFLCLVKHEYMHRSCHNTILIYRIGRVFVPVNVHRTTFEVLSISIVKLGGNKYTSKIFSSGFLV